MPCTGHQLQILILQCDIHFPHPGASCLRLVSTLWPHAERLSQRLGDGSIWLVNPSSDGQGLPEPGNPSPVPGPCTHVHGMHLLCRLSRLFFLFVSNPLLQPSGTIHLYQHMEVRLSRRLSDWPSPATANMAAEAALKVDILVL